MTSNRSMLRGTIVSRALFLISIFISQVTAVLNATESSAQLILSNDRLFAAVTKSKGAIHQLTLDGQDLLGPISGSTGIGPYLDCYCVPSGFYTPGSVAPKYQLLSGTDSTNTAWGGIVMSEVYPPTGQLLEQYWFLRDGETGLHTFSRLAYYNKTKPFLRNLQEFRTLFRPNTNLWTHLLTNEKQYAPLPSTETKAKQVVVQDATWYLGNTQDDAYVQQEDGSTSKDGSTFGSWLVMNTKDTYFGGPMHSDLQVDGIVYNYMGYVVSNHHGAGTPNITDGFDRTFGPQYYYFNKGAPSTPMEELRKDALQFYSPTWNSAFYDAIAKHIPNYVPSSVRGTWKGQASVPKGASKPIAVLAQNDVDFQDNVLHTSAYQYWGDIDSKTGKVSIPSVKAGTYRLTVYAEGFFGQYTQDNVRISAGRTASTKVRWKEESSGNEIWRIGTPDKSPGEYRHGYELDLTHPLQPEQYRSYWAVHDFPTEFPQGVRFEVGKSKEVEDLNYVHWSVFGGYASSIRTVPRWENVNNWTLLWDMEKKQSKGKKATFTVQLSGAKTAAGTQMFYHSSSCAVRSAVICYNIANKFVFDARLLVKGKNEIVLSLPANATDYESAILPQTTYVQYDALRLEVGS
ncbi:family 4 polysaccharide lyase [Amylocarpus encephaloides]|uniref:rhamnogalacturonan endolyase n=1 Tax=Amylocarpus encephaloides TaxID=45428 RepID=A0A9P8C442_9HELO|nr:family 4 polysaccharide lyase [Amylocarpus encephaloides]